MSQESLLYLLTLGCVGLLAMVSYPALADLTRRVFGRYRGYQRDKVAQATKALDDVFIEVKPMWLKVVYGLGPVLAGGAAWLLLDSVPAAGAAAVVGVVLPDLWVRQTRAFRKRRFQGQLVDALFILSSSLKAGLSLTQAFEVLEAEIPPPASQEFGLVIKAHRLGRSFEEALQSLNDRMACEEMHLVTTSILVARETGGDVTEIIGQLVGAIREKKKLNDKVFTLTMQGRLQAYIMSFLPLGFAFFVRTFNPKFFNVLLEDPTGQRVLAAACVLWVIGMFLLMRMSRVRT